jgi:putative hydrolase of the HAD superfamily
MKIKFVIFDWGGTLGKSGQRDIFIRAKKNKSLTALHSDTIHTLQELKRKGVPMAILSNTKYTRADMHKGLKKSNLKKYFKFEIYSSDDDQSCGKPCGDIYSSSYKLVKQMIPNIRKKQILYVGDNYYADVMGAQNFGFSAAYIVNEDFLKYYLAELLGNQEITLYKISDLIEHF